ncbi:hypothetical protein SAMN05444338_10756 [Flavobacterium degerlachei]|jgi:hypothetical protein|uniref:Uncharacterized protein n=2 Tax=Flavobacterium degerlachei TaxID=229203 RepID=A0A1H2Z1I7_9FLAO|nr:hypothetical protein SAMN05444338_10756 [Flavobacterium degerlachei]
MEGKELLNELLSKRDYSGNEADEYAQFLSTLMVQLGEKLYPLLEKAQSESKRLALKPSITESDILVDEYTVSDITFI